MMNAATLYDGNLKVGGVAINQEVNLRIPMLKGRTIKSKLGTFEEVIGFALAHELTHILENERLIKKLKFTSVKDFMNSIERRHESENAAVESEIMYLVENHNYNLTESQIDWYIDLMTDFQTYLGDKKLNLL